MDEHGDMATLSATDVVARLSGVTKSFGTGASAVEVLHGIGLEVLRSEFTAVMGPSGSGKSTLMQIMAGLDAPTSGHIDVAGNRLEAMNDNALTDFRARTVGFVFQSFNLLPSLNVKENILMPLRLSGTSISKDLAEWLTALTTRLGIGDLLTRMPAALSGGQQQRVAIARALITRPPIVFADEPTGSLDAASGRGVLSVLRGLVDDLGTTLVMVTHDPVAASYADRIVALKDGRIVDDSPAANAATIAERMFELEAAR